MGVNVQIQGDRLVVTPRGLDKLWAFRRRIDVPVAHVTAATIDPFIAREQLRGLRWPGTSLPGLITAGTFYQDGKRTFWLVHNPRNVVVIDLAHEAYARLIIEVDDPRAVTHLIHNARSSDA